MNTAVTPSKRCYTMPNWPLLIFFVFTTFSVNFVSSSSAYQISYADHCASIIPESTPIGNRFSISPLYQLHHGHFYVGGGNDALSRKSLNRSPNSVSFETRNVYATDAEDVFKVESTLTLHRGSTADGYPYSMLGLHGFWSVSSGKICMVETGFNNIWEDIATLLLDLPVVFKLNNLKNTTSLTSLVTGTLECMTSSDEPDYFEPISLFMFPKMNYYTLASDEVLENNSSLESDANSPGLSLESFMENTFCSIVPMQVTNFNLKYASHCSTSAKNCNPLGSVNDFLPSVMVFDDIECSGDEQRLRVLIQFLDRGETLSNYSWLFNPNTTLVGEGLWDAKTNQLNIIACPFLDAADSLAEAHVGDCSTRLSLKFPAMWTIRINSNTIVGQIWSNKTKGEFGYFDKVRLESSQPFLLNDSADFKYKYTKLDKARTSCPRKKSAKHKGYTYLNVFSEQEMMFHDMSVQTSAKTKLARAYSHPLFIGDDHFKLIRMELQQLSRNSSSTKAGTIDTISYTILMSLLPHVKLDSEVSMFLNASALEISAEGIYDDATGSLCMVGCRSFGLGSKFLMDDDFVDCEILINIQISPRNSTNGSSKIEGSIESTRKKSDPLHFDRLELSSSTSDMPLCSCDMSYSAC
ncbi:hypothetical protein FNV43_RR25524 [Rhamnella rubrinervis]|uniref:DUF2921 domain-containing protein n=1 Tax=Rhamnella rubrinervis TaxID=2594499 RepID=A0A8K0DPT9_9ROSA|nr:hypothetical protein FNV43_RR25524 [Rhamnella rubrinervis]